MLTLWAVLVERSGFDCGTALTLGQAGAGSSVYVKGVSLGIIEPRPELLREQVTQLSDASACMSICSAGR